MLKIFNITTLLLFVCFLFAPTATFALNKNADIHSVVINEEEEVPSEIKSKAGNNNINEEEEKEVQYHFFHKFSKLSRKPIVASKNLNLIKNAIKDDLVFKIPLPPPEQIL